MTTANGSVVRRSPAELHRKSLKIGRLQQGKSRAKGSRVGDDLVEAFEEMAKHLRGEIELEAAYNPPGSAMTPAHIRAIRLKVASSTKEFRASVRDSSADNGVLRAGAAQRSHASTLAHH